MKIGMLLDKTFPPDIRVEKEARALIKAGHQIHLLAIQKRGQPLEETVENLQVHRYRTIKGKDFGFTNILEAVKYLDVEIIKINRCL